MLDWLDRLAGAFAGTGEEPDLDVCLSDAGSRARLRVRSGTLEQIEPAGGGQPDLEIEFSKLALRDVLFGQANVCEVLHDVRLSAGGEPARPLPVAEGDLPITAGYELIPGATLKVAYQVGWTIFGNVGMCEEWRDGALASSEVVPISGVEGFEADVQIACPLAQLAAVRRREVTFLDFIAAGGGVRGDWPQLMCFAELIQHPAYAPLWDGPTVVSQLAWAEVFCSQAWGDAVQRAGESSQSGAIA
jgi:hypothetical protein